MAIIGCDGKPEKRGDGLMACTSGVSRSSIDAQMPPAHPLPLSAVRQHIKFAVLNMPEFRGYGLIVIDSKGTSQMCKPDYKLNRSVVVKIGGSTQLMAEARRAPKEASHVWSAEF